MHFQLIISILIFSFAPIIQSSKPAYHATRRWQRSTSTSGHQISMTLKANVPVVYLDQLDGIDNVKCLDDGQIALTLADLNIVNSWDHKKILLVMGEYAHGCFDFPSSLRLAKEWRSYDDDRVVVFETVDPSTAGVVGSYEIDINPTERRRPVHAPPNAKEPQNFEWPFDIDMKFDRKIPFAHNQYLVECAPCNVKGNAKLRVSVNGTLFTNDADIKATISGQLSSVFMINAHLQNTTDKTDSLNIYQIPLGPIKIPNIIDVGPSFAVNVRADVKSSENAIVSTGIHINIPPFDAELLHIGGKDSSSMGERKYVPKMTQQPTSIIMKDFQTEFSFDSKMAAFLSLTPKFQMGLTVFGQTIAQGAKLELENTLSVKASKDDNCASHAMMDIDSHSTIQGQIGTFSAPISKLAQKDIFHDCITVH